MKARDQKLLRGLHTYLLIKDFLIGEEYIVLSHVNTIAKPKPKNKKEFPSPGIEPGF